MIIFSLRNIPKYQKNIFLVIFLLILIGTWEVNVNFDGNI